MGRGESAKGHNGVKSVQASLQGGGWGERLGAGFVKIGVGIGRPVSREKGDVSDYVLGAVGGEEMRRLRGAAGVLEGVLRDEVERLEKIS